VQPVVDRLGTVEAVDLLLALTEADARATAPKAWSAWRAGLVTRLAERVRSALASDPADPGPVSGDLSIPDEARRGGTSVEVRPVLDGATVTIIAEDRVGLLADVAAALALQPAPVRGLRAWEQDGWGVSTWEVAEPDLDPAVLRQRLGAIAEGRIDPTTRLSLPPAADLDPIVVVRPEASSRATVLEVRTADRPGTVYRVCAALAELDLSVRSAHAETLGPQAVDVFYVQETGAGVLSDERAATAAHAVRAALGPRRDTPGTG
jgi:[protein-PII] uridylyltransferase